MATKKKMLQAAAGNAGESLAIEDVFSTYLYTLPTYTSDPVTATINSGIDFTAEDGMVWIKSRTYNADHFLFDSVRGISKSLDTSANSQELDETSYGRTVASTTTGIEISGVATTGLNYQDDYASWTFRKAPRFFDIVTYTGDGTSGRVLNHNLGVTPGFIVIKRRDANGSWYCAGRDGGGFIAPNVSSGLNFVLNGTDAGDSAAAGNVASSTTFNLNMGTTSANNYSVTNINGATYVAYLFAHDPLGPSGDGSDGLIACGSYTGNGSDDGPEIDLGWEPQWFLVKKATGSGGYWYLYDNMRGMGAKGVTKYFLNPNFEFSEGSVDRFYVTSTGIKIDDANSTINSSGDTFIYIAIRRGPMRQPESGTEVFTPITKTGDGPTVSLSEIGFQFDAVLNSVVAGTYGGNSSYSHRLSSRVTGLNTDSSPALVTASYAAENTYFYTDWDGETLDVDTGWGATKFVWHFLKRAPGFFDVVSYAGNGTSSQTIKHNLGVAPEMMWVKVRSGYTYGWYTYDAPTGAGSRMRLDDNGGHNPDTSVWANTAPTETSFTVGATYTNGSSGQFIAYLFASAPGVSKIGSYTGNGSSQTIDCGFTSGARFVLIKRTDNTGDWCLWDAARGIVTSTEPYFYLNQISPEVTAYDSIDPDSSGFIVNQTTTDINISSASYIYLAIA